MKYAYEIGPEEKEEFLECLRDGMPPDQAAKEAGSNGTQMRKCYSGNSERYFDPEFGAAVDEVFNSAERHRAVEEVVRGMVWESAQQGNWNARYKLALTYLPEFEWDRHKNFNVNVQMQALIAALPGLTLEELERVQKAYEIEEPEVMKALEAVPDVIEAA